MSNVVLNAKKRETGKQIAKQYRAAGTTPGVFYGNKVESTPILVETLDLRPIVYTAQTKVVELNIEGSSTSHRCVLKDVVFHPVTDKIVHFDLLNIVDGQMLTVNVPIKLVGTATGVKSGGIMSQVIRKVKLKCLAENLPEFIEVDVTKLEIGKSITLNNLKNDKFEFAIKQNAVICTVLAPRVRKDAGK